LVKILVRVSGLCGNLRNLFLVNYGMVGRLLSSCLPLDSEIHEALDALAAGRKFAAIAITEKSGGSNPRGQTTQVKKTSGKFKLSGEKRWITGGYIADFYLVQAWVDNELRFVYVPANSAGLSAEEIMGTMGARGSGLAIIKFDDVTVEDFWILPTSPSGFAPISSTDYVMKSGRLFAGASALGIGLAAIDGATKVLRKKNNSRGTLYTQGDWQQRISKMYIESLALKELLSNLSKCFDIEMRANIDKFTPFKILSTEFSIRASQLFFEAAGADSYSDQSYPNRLLREALAGNFIEGGNAVLIQKCSFDWAKMTISGDIYDPF